jgi:hypothetical protein
MSTPVPMPSRRQRASVHRVLALGVTLLLAVLLSCSLAGPRAKAAPGNFLTGLRLVDYFPASDGWGSMWSNWRASRIETDFARIAALNANGVRVIVNAPAFGFPDVDPLMLDRLSQTIAIAAKYGLRVELTLFDGWQEYEDLAGSKAWASQLLSTLAGDPRIAYIDLHNELPADTDAAALRWAATMIPFVQARDGGIPVTVSTSISSGPAPLRALVDRLRSSPPDLYDVHYYGNAQTAFAILRQAKGLAGKTPIFVGETGFATDSSYGWAEGLHGARGSSRQPVDSLRHARPGRHPVGPSHGHSASRRRSQAGGKDPLEGVLGRSDRALLQQRLRALQRQSTIAVDLAPLAPLSC